MIAYFCQRCPLAFKVGYYVWGSLGGGSSQYVCSGCGTLHRVDHGFGQPDVLMALKGPIRNLAERTVEWHDGSRTIDRDLPHDEMEWRLIAELPTSAEVLREKNLPARLKGLHVDELVCAVCRQIGTLATSDWPIVDGYRPIFGELCPVCRGELEDLYVES